MMPPYIGSSPFLSQNGTTLLSKVSRYKAIRLSRACGVGMSIPLIFYGFVGCKLAVMLDSQVHRNTHQIRAVIKLMAHR